MLQLNNFSETTVAYHTPVWYINPIMMDEAQKTKVGNRLRRIQGQIGGIEKMIQEDRYCIDILTQVSAVVSALRGVEDAVMQNHLNTCVADAMRSEDPREQQDKVDEVLTVITKFRKHG